jgi:hypothetical protein
VLQTVWRPRHRLETLLVDWSAVDDAPSIRPVVYPPERGAHLSEDGRIGLGEGEIFFLELVNLAEVAGIGLVGLRGASGFDFLAKALDQFPLERQQSPSLIVDIHGLPICVSRESRTTPSATWPMSGSGASIIE